MTPMDQEIRHSRESTNRSWVTQTPLGSTGNVLTVGKGGWGGGGGEGRRPNQD